MAIPMTPPSMPMRPVPPGGPMPGPPPGQMPPGGPSPQMPSPDELRQMEIIRMLDAAQDTGLPPSTLVPRPYAPPTSDIRRRGGV